MVWGLILFLGVDWCLLLLEFSDVLIVVIVNTLLWVVLGIAVAMLVFYIGKVCVFGWDGLVLLVRVVLSRLTVCWGLICWVLGGLLYVWFAGNAGLGLV